MNRQNLAQAVARTAHIRIWGKISAALFIVAVLAVLDGLQDLARHDFNRFDLIPGETTYISGMLPEGTASHEELEILIDGMSGMTVRPFQSFKGFWLGGQMWRAEVTVPSSAASGTTSLTVVDLVRATRKITPDSETDEAGGLPSTGGAEAGNNASSTEIGEELPLVQNPTLVYSVVIWPDATARQAAEKSFVRRFLGISPFWVAGIAAILAILAGIKGWLTFSKIEKSLAETGLYMIYGVKKPGSPSPSGYRIEAWQASCAYYDDASVEVGDNVALYDNTAGYRGQGIIREMKSGSFMVEFPAAGTVPAYGWIVSKHMPQA